MMSLSFKSFQDLIYPKPPIYIRDGIAILEYVIAKHAKRYIATYFVHIQVALLQPYSLVAYLLEVLYPILVESAGRDQSLFIN